jgi:hypothetical protein
MRAEIRRLRARIPRLVSGEHLALTGGIVDCLDRLRGLGVDQR